MDATATAIFDLVGYARKHRYRLRNLHDGHPVPPAIYRGSKDHSLGAWGQEDRWDAIVGYDGYVAMDGDVLSVCLFYKSALGVNRARARIEAMGGQVAQEGDHEISGTVQVDRIEDALKLIRVSRVPLRNPGGNPVSLGKGPISERGQPAESPERPDLDPEYPGNDFGAL